MKLFPHEPIGIRCNIGDKVEPYSTHAGSFIGSESRLGFTREEIDQIEDKSVIKGLHLIFPNFILVYICYFFRFEQPKSASSMPKNLKVISNRQDICPIPKNSIKTLLILCVLFFGFQALKAKEVAPQKEETHQHDGFYLSMSGGLAFGTVTDHLISSLDGPYTLDFSGQGLVMDVKIGWAVQENLILHATLISNTVSDPTIEQKDNQHPTYDEYSGVVEIGDAMVGAGLTYYVMPSNILFSGSMGLGKFMVTDVRSNHKDITASTGLSMQLKLGKEWWVSKNWGLGIGLTYGNTAVSCEPRIKQSERMSSNRIGIVLNTTFN